MSLFEFAPGWDSSPLWPVSQNISSQHPSSKVLSPLSGNYYPPASHSWAPISDPTWGPPSDFFHSR